MSEPMKPTVTVKQMERAAPLLYAACEAAMPLFATCNGLGLCSEPAIREVMEQIQHALNTARTRKYWE